MNVYISQHAVARFQERFLNLEYEKCVKIILGTFYESVEYGGQLDNKDVYRLSEIRNHRGPGQQIVLVTSKGFRDKKPTTIIKTVLTVEQANMNMSMTIKDCKFLNY